MKAPKRLICALMACALLACMLSGCDRNDVPDDAEPSVTDDTDAPVQAPDGFVDNQVDPGDYTEAELYLTDPDKNAIIGVNDPNVYYRNAGFTARFAVNMISSASGDAVPGLPVSALEGHVDYIRLGDAEYQLEDLVRPRSEGFAVLEMLAADFGIDKYAEDENGAMRLEACMGTGVFGDALREAYSERADLEDYTVCVYYLHARMNGMAQSEYDKCREALVDAHGIDHSSLLDGTLAVMLYYDTSGYDLFYAVAVSAPGYWTDYEDFLANPDNQVRHDVTNCMMMMDGVKPVGFVNQVFIRCDQDTSGLMGASKAGAETDGNAGGAAPINEAAENVPADDAGEAQARRED